MSEDDRRDFAEAEAGLERWREALRRMAERNAPAVEPIHLDVLRASRDAGETMALAAMHDHVALTSMIHRQDVADGHA